MHYPRSDRLSHFWVARDEDRLRFVHYWAAAAHSLYGRITLFVALLFFIAPAALASSIQITNAWVKQAPPGAHSMAAYLLITNTSTADIELLQLSSPAFRHVEIHQTVLVDGIAKMRKQASIKIAANSRFALKPGGYHLMLIGANVDPAALTEASVELHFSNGEKKTVLLPIRPITSADMP